MYEEMLVVSVQSARQMGAGGKHNGYSLNLKARYGVSPPRDIAMVEK